MKELSIKPTKSISDTTIRNNSPVVLAFLAHMHANGLSSDKAIPERLRNLVDSNAYAGPLWPLTLELVHLQMEGTTLNKSKAGPALRMLHDKNISFIDWNAAPKVFISDPLEADQHDKDPDYAIEDFTSDYDHESEKEDSDDNFDPDDFPI